MVIYLQKLLALEEEIELVIEREHEFWKLVLDESCFGGLFWLFESVKVETINFPLFYDLDAYTKLRELLFKS